MDTFEEIVADRKRWVPFRKATFAGLDSFKPKDVEQIVAEAKQTTKLRNALETVVKIGEESDMPTDVFQAVVRKTIMEWAKNNDAPLVEYLLLKAK